MIVKMKQAMLTMISFCFNEYNFFGLTFKLPFPDFIAKPKWRIEDKMKEERTKNKWKCERNGATVEFAMFRNRYRCCGENIMRSSSLLLSLYRHRHHHHHHDRWKKTLKRTLILYILCLHSISLFAWHFLLRSLFNTSSISVSLEQFSNKTYVEKDSFVGWIEWIYCGHYMKQSHFANYR